MIRTLKRAQLLDREGYRVPRTTRDIVPVRALWRDGIFLCGNRYTRTYRFSDINYETASSERKAALMDRWCEILNALDPGAAVKLTLSSYRPDRGKRLAACSMPLRGDFRDLYRMEYNRMVSDRIAGTGGYERARYLTVSKDARDRAEAAAYFDRTTARLRAQFAELGSSLEPLDAAERLRILHGFFRAGEEETFPEDPEELFRPGRDPLACIAPDSFSASGNRFRLGSRVGTALFLREFPSTLPDSILAKLTDVQSRLFLSADIVPVPTDEAVRELQNRLMSVETDITGWQRRQNENRNYVSQLPPELEMRREEARRILEDVMSNDQRLLPASFTLVLLADSEEDLQRDTATVLDAARGCLCQLSTLWFRQREGMQTALPVGVHRAGTYRTFTTESLGIFVPFRVREIRERSGVCLGVNAVSKNLILASRDGLMNQSAFVLGVPGSGKSFTAKELIAYQMLSGDDDIIICDPENEYGDLVRELGPDISSVVRIDAGGRDRINAMEMVEGYGEGNPVAEKSQFILSLLEQIDRKSTDAAGKSLIDRCTDLVFREAAADGRTPTLCDLRASLLRQPEPQAARIALCLELFTEGSLSIFGREGNVRTDRRVLVFDIHALGPQLKPIALLVITDAMLNRVNENFRRGRRTHVLLDEFHVVFENEYSASFFASAWRQFRKRNACPTAVTQNVEYLLDSVKARTMLSNSEFVIMLNQAASDREKLRELFQISPEEMKYITNVRPGDGLIRYGASLVPFENPFPHGSELYRLMTTKPGEWGGAVRKRGENIEKAWNRASAGADVGQGPDRGPGGAAPGRPSAGGEGSGNCTAEGPAGPAADGGTGTPPAAPQEGPGAGKVTRPAHGGHRRPDPQPESR